MVIFAIFTLPCFVPLFFSFWMDVGSGLNPSQEQILVDVLEMSAGKQIEAAYRKNGDGVGC